MAIDRTCPDCGVRRPVNQLDECRRCGSTAKVGVAVLEQSEPAAVPTPPPAPPVQPVVPNPARPSAHEWLASDGTFDPPTTRTEVPSAQAAGAGIVASAPAALRPAPIVGAPMVVGVSPSPVGRGASKSFAFDGGAGSYLGTGILAFLITLCTLGICLPYAIVLRQRWRAKHTYINGHRLVFLGTGAGLFAQWIKWFLLSIVTVGIYMFWVAPRLQKWVVENTDFDPAVVPQATHYIAGRVYAPLA